MWGDALSALADGEESGIDERLVAVHVARCPDCRSYKELIDAQPRIVRVAEPKGMPDLARKVSKLIQAMRRAHDRWPPGKWRLVVQWMVSSERDFPRAKGFSSRA